MVGPLVGVDGGRSGTVGTPFLGAFAFVLGFTGLDSGALA